MSVDTLGCFPFANMIYYLYFVGYLDFYTRATLLLPKRVRDMKGRYAYEY